MCAVVLKVRYSSPAEPSVLIELESAEQATERQQQLESTGTVESITWYRRAEKFQRTVSYPPVSE